MSDSEAAMRYLTRPAQTFWQWGDYGEVVALTDGRTIAFRTELIQVLRRLASDGLPPLGAVLLLLAAMRLLWRSTSSDLSRMSGLIEFLKISGAPPRSSDVLVDPGIATPEWVVEVFQGLNRISALPVESRATTAARAELVAIVCEGRRLLSPTEAAAVLHRLERGLPEELFPTKNSRLGAETATTKVSLEQLDLLYRDLRCLSVGLPRLNPKRLELRVATSLDELPTAARQELLPAQRVRALLAELRNDSELGGVSRLALNLMAAVHLPRPVSDRDDLPLGGVSDISNRGSLDRLLVSELANDDLTLAVRVAVNEALYLRREVPARDVPRQRMILLDTGLRLWGVPRIFATAVGLALAATADRQITVHVFRAAGHGVVPVDFTSRAGLIEHLGSLEPVAQPAAALPAFAAEVAKARPAADAVVVTGEDVLADTNFARALSQTVIPGMHLGGVNRDGRFRLFATKTGRQRALCDVQLDLEEILKPPRQTLPLVDKRRTIAPPAILPIRPFPLLLSHQFVVERAWAVKGKGVFTLSRDRRLLYWQNDKQGGRQLSDRVPEGALHWASVGPGEVTTRAVVGKLSRRGLYLLSVDLDRDDCQLTRLELGSENPRNVSSHNGAILVIFDRHAEAFSLATGGSLGWCEFPLGWQWFSQRFLANRFIALDKSVNWYAICSDGMRVYVEPVDRSATEAPPLLAIFDAYGVDGPVGLTTEGELFFTADKTIVPLKHELAGRIRLAAIARDGLRLVIESESSHSAKKMIYVINPKVAPVVYSHPQYAVEPEASQSIRTRIVRHRFQSIASLGQGKLGLYSRKGRWTTISFDSTSRSIVQRPAEIHRKDIVAPSFDRDCSDSEVGYTLHAADWSDGSLAFLDSRGLLHLRSGDSSIPELTLVLADGCVSGWIADGRCFGLSYFTGREETVAPQIAFSEVLEPFIARLPFWDPLLSI